MSFPSPGTLDLPRSHRHRLQSQADLGLNPALSLTSWACLGESLSSVHLTFAICSMEAKVPAVLGGGEDLSHSPPNSYRSHEGSMYRCLQSTLHTVGAQSGLPHLCFSLSSQALHFQHLDITRVHLFFYFWAQRVTWHITKSPRFEH